MNFIRSLYPKSEKKRMEDCFVAELLDECGFFGKGKLLQSSDFLLHYFLNKSGSVTKLLKALIKYLFKQREQCQITKMLTIIHRLISLRRTFSEEDLECLQSINFCRLHSQGEKWFTEFLHAYLSFLVKRASLSDICSCMRQESELEPQFHLTQIFRISNMMSTLFPHVQNAFTIVGRYQPGRFPEVQDLFLTLSQDLAMFYAHLSTLSDSILNNFENYAPNELQCFIQSLPELSLLREKIEELIYNKYYEGQALWRKWEFCEQKIDHLNSYLEAYKENETETSIESGENSSDWSSKGKERGEIVIQTHFSQSICLE